jgi:hypothetical protein
MYTLFYKMTHDGDPDPFAKVWGVQDCMGSVRNRDFNAVIGIGGSSFSNHENKIVWIGIEPKRIDSPYKEDRGKWVVFKHFVYFGSKGRLLDEESTLSKWLALRGQGAFRSDLREKNIKKEIDEILNDSKIEQPIVQLSLLLGPRGRCSCVEICE